jgi:hypothetical protein
MEKQQLALGEGGGKQLIDILCLADYPQIKAGPGAANTVHVSLVA